MVKPGQTIGETDELGFSPAGDAMELHDFHATMLRLLGLDHTRLTIKVQGRDFRLTDVSGRVVEKAIAEISRDASGSNWNNGETIYTIIGQWRSLRGPGWRGW